MLIRYHSILVNYSKKKKSFDQSIEELSNAIYLLSITHGPESPQIVASYALMGKLFLEKNDPGSYKKVTRFYEKVIFFF